MGISVADFVTGGFIVTTEGPEGSYVVWLVSGVEYGRHGTCRAG